MKIEKIYRIQQGRKALILSKNEDFLPENPDENSSNKLPINLTINTSFQRSNILLSTQDATDLIEALKSITEEEYKPIVKN